MQHADDDYSTKLDKLCISVFVYVLYVESWSKIRETRKLIVDAQNHYMTRRCFIIDAGDRTAGGVAGG